MTETLRTVLTPPAFRSRVLPVIVISHVDQALPLAHALLEGGIDVMEITLRHPAGMAAIEVLAQQVPQMLVGAGSLTRVGDVARVKAAGARFALSPGLDADMVEEAARCALPFIPGVMTPSELMQAARLGLSLLKLFPAREAGGLAMLDALAGPFPEARYCPTGGVTLANLGEYLRHPKVAMVGGSWITPLQLVEAGQWSEISRLARAASDVAASA